MENLRFKFRAYDKIDKRLIIGEQDFIPLIVTNKGVFKLDPCCEYNRWIEIEKDRFILMHSTGLLDKHGVEVFEGDIICFDMDTFYKRIFTVIYDSGRFGIQTDEGFRCLSDWIIIQKDNNTISCEVIGNIYENKELLV